MAMSTLIKACKYAFSLQSLLLSGNQITNTKFIDDLTVKMGSRVIDDSRLVKMYTKEQQELIILEKERKEKKYPAPKREVEQRL